jgi:hypothetical protein
LQKHNIMQFYMRSAGQTPINTNSRNRTQVFSLAFPCLFTPYGAHDATDNETENILHLEIDNEVNYQWTNFPGSWLLREGILRNALICEIR